MGTLKASQFRDPSEFDPALGGKYLMGLEGLIELGHNVNYIFPQLFNAKDKTPATSIDHPHLGKPHDVWTGGIYAYNMCMAYDITEDSRYLIEAKNAVDKLFESASFTVSNSVFTKKFDDPYEFPVNEVSSAPWGVAASQWLYNKTNDPKYLKYSEYFRNITLRLMTWYESSLRDDPVDQSIQSQGLMHAYSTADTPTAWENIMTYMPMLMELKNSKLKPSELVLKMFNVFRINNFYMYGVTWDPSVLKTFASNYTSHPAGYLPVEDFYTAETPTPMGLSGPTVYMSSNPFYAYIMFEAFSETSDREIMALNLDVNDQPQHMMESITRNFIYFNPTDTFRTFTIRMKNLKEGKYSITVTDSKGRTITKKRTKDELEKGFEQTLSPMDYVRVKLELANNSEVVKFEQMVRAQNKLMLAYKFLQESGRDFGVNETLNSYKAAYLRALEKYKSGNYAAAAGIINSFIDKIPLVDYSETSTRILNPQNVNSWSIKGSNNIAKGKYASTDSGIGARAIDGALGVNNTWISDESKDKHYLVVDLGERKTIGRYVVYHAGEINNTADFEIQSSDDNASWEVRDVVRGNTADVTERYIQPFTARYVRLNITKPMQNDGKIARIQEFELYEADTLELENFTTISRWNISDNAVISTDGRNATVKSTGTSWGYAAAVVNYNVDEYPVLQIDVPEVGVGAKWNVMVNDGSGSDVFLFESSANTGTMHVNLKNKTGWSGNKTFTIKLAVIGDSGKYFKVNSIQAIVNNANVMYNKLVATSSGDAVKAIDGVVSAESIWVSDQQGEQFIQVDLESEMEIGRYVVKHSGLLGDLKNNTVGFTLYSSTDGMNWTIRDKVTDNKELQSPVSGNEPGLQLPPLVIDMTDSTGVFTEGGATAHVSSEGMRITGWNGTNVKKQVTYNVTDYPKLEITFANMTMPVHMQVWDGSSSPVFIVPAAISSDGTYKIDLAGVTGWRGVKTFYIIFYPQEEGSADITHMRALTADSGDNGNQKNSIDDDFSSVEQWKFSENAKISKNPEGGAIVTETAGTFGYVAKQAELNVDEFPRLQVIVTEVSDTARFHIMVNDGLGSDIFLSRMEMTMPGVYNFDLPIITKWSGNKSVTIKLAVIGGAGSYIKVKSISTHSVPKAVAITDREVEPFHARYLKLVIDNPGQDGDGRSRVCEFEAYSTKKQILPSIIPGENTVTVSTGSFNTAFAEKLVSYDIGTNQLLCVNVSDMSSGARWNIMLNDNLGGPDILLMTSDSSSTGVFTFDLKQLLGWSSIKGFTIKVVVTGGINEFVRFSDINAVSLDKRSGSNKKAR